MTRKKREKKEKEQKKKRAQLNPKMEHKKALKQDKHEAVLFGIRILQ